MIEFYVKLVHAGKMTIDDVPEKWREAVRQRTDTKTTPTLLMQSTEESTPADESESTDEKDK